MFDTLFEERTERENLAEERAKAAAVIREEDLLDKLEYVLDCLSIVPETDIVNNSVVLENYQLTTAYSTTPRDTEKIILYIENITTKQESYVTLTQSPNDVRVRVTDALFNLK